MIKKTVGFEFNGIIYPTEDAARRAELKLKLDKLFDPGYSYMFSHTFQWNKPSHYVLDKFDEVANLLDEYRSK